MCLVQWRIGRISCARLWKSALCVHDSGILRNLPAPYDCFSNETCHGLRLYAWTRNPMALASLALLVSLGVWFQSALFVLWALALCAPALLFFLKMYEERELELRFGTSYLEYKSRTPMLFPRRPNPGGHCAKDERL
ncbi:MAG: methyltransferase [Acidobacteriota bacterium]